MCEHVHGYEIMNMCTHEFMWGRGGHKSKIAQMGWSHNILLSLGMYHVIY